MKKIFVLLFILFSVNVYAEVYISEIKSLENEKWYGAYTAKAFCNTPLKDLTFQPYQDDEKLKDLRKDNRGNQAAPLLISNLGRYVWSNEPFAFELKNGSLIIHSDIEKIEAFVAGKTLREAYLGAMKKYFPPSGKTPNELMFKMPQYNMWIELNYNQDQPKVLKYANDIIKNNFPTGVFMIDDIWSKDYGNFSFDPSKFPNPKAMVDELHSKGFKVMLWLTPFVSPDSKEFEYLSKNKCLVLKKDSKSPAIIKWWNGYSACLDLSKPNAIDWLRTKLKNLQNTYGIDGFKFDAVDFDFYTKGSKVFPNEDTNTSGPIQAEMFGKLGAEFDFNEFRAGWKNGNQPIAQRLQDKQYSWDDLKLLVPDMLSAGLIGHPFTCPDMIGGGLLSTFENIDYTKFDQELMVRSAQIQALMPMMQFSVAPWRVLDEKHLNIVREAAQLHAKMGNYIIELSKNAAVDGEPIVRHLEYVFPQQGFESCDNQFMLGNKYLVTPMIDKGYTRTVKLPRGNWIDETGKKYQGGQSIQINVPLNRLPYFTLQD
ncbi:MULTISPECIES: glycoside hydrolase family 31 protein [unclassified Arcicella]|uniref:glycoside hydrolase family 31 protein n=1 Tax=unclassified Arcicella TaxID=2644986 RepID=UPI0028606F51|nr:MULTISPECIES: glycoside hydrolase family 31 protein [unclassified Arcicella]MDR6562269.1 alpha-glucosidase [Arcicella sp. BE51]MDR6812037.1 alpha-glucosidase [Arcicella sp. BE140]MDR6823348.1 alpha-glucosidase [Arcicella sp. BE139]